MTDGKGCKCGAYSCADCDCPDVDWSCFGCDKLKAELAEAVATLTDMANMERFESINEDRLDAIDAFPTKHRSTT